MYILCTAYNYIEIYSKEKKNILILPKYANHTLVVYNNAA